MQLRTANAKFLVITAGFSIVSGRTAMEFTPVIVAGLPRERLALLRLLRGRKFYYLLLVVAIQQSRARDCFG
jgi:hypothetical protein